MVKGNKKQYWWHLLLIAVLTLLAYAKVFDAGFMSWDDPEYILQNPDITCFCYAGKWFSTFYIGNYQPLTMLSYALDYVMGQQEPFMYHATNIVLHMANALLVYALIKRVTAKADIALIVALLFSLHPVQTESVSWVAERKNVLSGLFFLVAMNLYAVYVIRRTPSLLLYVFVAGLAAMLSKASAVTLPISLFAIDIWMKRPFRGGRIWLEKVPLTLLALAIGIIAIYAQQEGQFLGANEHSWYETPLYAGYAYVQYIVNLLVPVKLSVLYPYPAAISGLNILFGLLAIAILALGVWAWKRSWFMLCGGILFYTVNIAIVLQFVQFGEVLMADRYLYIASIGIWLPATYYLKLWSVRKLRSKWGLVAAGAITGIYLLVTFSRNDIWLSEQGFWESVVETFPESSVAQNSVGGVYMNMGNYAAAKGYVEEAISLDPNNSKAWYNKGVLHLRQGDARNALNALNRSISLNENNKALFSRAMLYEQTNQPQRALADIEKVLQQEPQNARAHFVKGSSLAQMGKMADAIVSYSQAIAIERQEPLYFIRRALAYAAENHQAVALADLDAAINIRPNAADAWYWRGIIKSELGRPPCDDLQQAYKLGYKDAERALSAMCTH